MRQQAIILLLGEVPEDLRGEMFLPNPGKSAPSYYAASVPRRLAVGEATAEVDGEEVAFEIGGYAPGILVIRTTVESEDIFRPETFDVEEKLLARARDILTAHGGNLDFSEAYTIFVVSQYDGPPEQFLDRSAIIASLLKSEREELAAREIEHTLKAQIKYGRDDLAIIDWDGAFLFDPGGDVQQEIELLSLANLQLLRHRILDRDLDGRLAGMAELVGEPRRGRLSFGHRDVERGLVQIIRDRMRSISELQRLEREIKLIGDWYSARFYELATAKFKIAEWRQTIRRKLESVEDIYSIVAENFSVSRKHRAEWIQIVLFFILQVGWLVLIILEFFYFTRGT